MNQSEQSFEAVRQLLKLKQHEIPPPGYFTGFSSQIISAIKEEGKESVKSQESLASSWFTRFLSAFDARPGVVGGLATSMVLFLVLGIVLADHSDNEIPANYAPDASLQPSAPLAAAALPTAEWAGSDQSASGGITISTNPVSLQPASSLFGPDNSLFQPANYVAAGSGAH
jgi:hypothetical protein